MTAILHSHTHCQVALVDTKVKTWQRVWLSNRTTDRQTDEEKEALGGNMQYSQKGFQWYAKVVSRISFFNVGYGRCTQSLSGHIASRCTQFPLFQRH